jgi:hypothetical protein
MRGMQHLSRMAVSGRMARRRHERGHSPLWVVAGLVLATIVLVGAIQVSNSTTALRGEVADLARACDNTEAVRARLSVRWNAASSRQVVMRRAQRELGMVNPAAPATILLATASDHVAPAARLAFVDPVPAAVADPVESR